MALALALLLAVIPVTQTGCPDQGLNQPGADAGSAPDGGAPACRAGSRWTSGTVAFREVTAEWGLSEVVGTRLSVTDIDGDGWADLLVRHGAGPDDFSPGGARRRWLLRNSGQGDFEDVTRSSGLFTGRINEDPDYGRPGEVLASGDVDGDGDLDIYFALARTDTLNATDETSELMINNGDGSFSLGPEDSDARFASALTSPSGVTFLDYDRDGNLDLWITHNAIDYQPMQDRLLRGDGSGRFTDVTAQSGLTTQPWFSVEVLNDGQAHSWGWSSAACDLNNDGDLELLASSYGRAPNHLWRNQISTGQPAFVNESVASGYAYDHRTDWRDNLSAQCHCADQPSDDECDTCPLTVPYSVCDGLRASFGGAYRWHHPSGREPYNLGGNSGATLCADIDNDGWVDLMTGEIVHSDVGSSSDPAEILVNLADPLVRFERPGNEVTGLTRSEADEWWDHGDMTGAVFDFDNDGWQDIYIGSSDYPDNKGLLYHQHAPLRFTQLALAEYFLHYRSHGIAVADFDRDGDLDVVVGHSLMRCGGGMPNSDECEEIAQIRMFENLMGENSNWLQLRLEGDVITNRAAIGARVEVAAAGQTQTQYVDGGHGHYNTQRDLALHFGLGTACEAEVTIVWPDRVLTAQTFTVPVNQRYHVLQGLTPAVAP